MNTYRFSMLNIYQVVYSFIYVFDNGVIIYNCVVSISGVNKGRDVRGCNTPDLRKLTFFLRLSNNLSTYYVCVRKYIYVRRRHYLKSKKKNHFFFLAFIETC